MFKATQEKKGSTLVLHLSGEIDEHARFDQEIRETAPEMVLHCQGISRINSLGVKGWIVFFKACVSRGTKLRFVHCSPTMVEQFGMISNFACGGTVESLYAPFTCSNPACNRELVALFTVEDLKKRAYKMPRFKCTLCGSPASFDDVEEEYFGFLIQNES